MKKVLLVVGLFFLPIMVGSQVYDSLLGIGSGVSISQVADNGFVLKGSVDYDGIRWNRCRKPDTTRWYIKEIKEKCDTAFTKSFTPIEVPAGYYGEIYSRSVKCRIDTTWAEKVQVWISPEQLVKLMKMIED